MRKTLAIKWYRHQIYFILFYFKLIEPFGEEIICRQNFWCRGICDETIFITKKQISSPKVIGDKNFHHQK